MIAIHQRGLLSIETSGHTKHHSMCVVVCLCLCAHTHRDDIKYKLVAVHIPVHLGWKLKPQRHQLYSISKCPMPLWFLLSNHLILTRLTSRVTGKALASNAHKIICIVVSWIAHFSWCFITILVLHVIFRAWNNLKITLSAQNMSLQKPKKHFNLFYIL